MRIANLQLKNFRCFTCLDLAFDNRIILIEGCNGVGKTSLLEALHYLCYLRSFRTHLPQELVQFGKENFFIKASVHESSNQLETFNVQVGFGNKKRLVKINEKSISSYKELLHYYRVITLTEDDVQLIKSGPEARRLFIDQAIVLANPDYGSVIKKCRDIVEQRTMLIKKGGSLESYQLWTEQLWKVSTDIQTQRIAMLATLHAQMAALISRYFNNEFTIDLAYAPKKALHEDFSLFMSHNPSLYTDESRMYRSLFGAQLDDFIIHFKDIKSKNFASRGQQKLITVLLKVAQTRLLLDQKGSVILLLDDFMTDFDLAKATTLITLLAELDVQLIFTIPSAHGFLQTQLQARGGQHVILTN